MGGKQERIGREVSGGNYKSGGAPKAIVVTGQAK
jgi:hypothetical protein